MEKLSNILNSPQTFLLNSKIVLSLILLILIIYYLINIGNKFVDQEKKIKLNLKMVLKILVIISIVSVTAFVFNKYSILGNTLKALLYSIIIAYSINPIINFLEKKSIKRMVGVLIVYIISLLILIILSILVVPEIINEFNRLITHLPEVVSKIVNNLKSLLADTSQPFDIYVHDLFGTSTSSIIESIQKSLTSLTDPFKQSLVLTLKEIASKLLVILSKIIEYTLILIFTFYFSVDKDKFKFLIIKNLPTKYREDVLYLAKRIDIALLDFLKGRILMAIFVGIATMIYLLILKVNFAIVIGMITCVADVIPYIGPFLAFIPAVLFAFMDSPIKALIAAILFIFIQWAENHLIAPKLLGDKTGLNPLVILLSLIIGGDMFGVVGLILAVPVVSVLYILLDFAKMKYINYKININ